MNKLIYLSLFVLICLTVMAEEKLVIKTIAIGDDQNPLFTNQGTKISLLFPLFLLGIVIIMVLVDFLAVGVTLGSLLILVIGIIFKILPLTWSATMSMVVMGIILIYKMVT